MHRWLSSAAVTLTVAAAALASASPATAAPPGDGGTTFTADGLCPFTVSIELTGKAKTIEHPDGSLIITSPGLVATVTNEETDASGTWSVAGTFHQSTLPSGNTLTRMTGRNLVWDELTGLVVISGDYSFEAAPDGSIVTHLNGTGNMIDVCEALS